MELEPTLPKLLPSWHDIALHDLLKIKGNNLYSVYNPPDYGGIGVDVSLNSNIHCRVPKYFKSQIKYSANKCALPFFTLKNLDYSIDPCLEHLDKEKLEFDKFSVRLSLLKSKTKNKNFRRNLKTLQEKISNSNFENHSEEINIFAPENVVQLANMLPKRHFIPEFNDSYAGGTLKVYKSDQQIFLHPVGKNMNKIGITPLLHGSDQHFKPDFAEQMTVKLKNEPILQIEHALNGFCVRQKSSFHLVNMANMTIHSKSAHKPALNHIAANPYNPQEVLSIFDKGAMKLRNMITGEASWGVPHIVYDYPYLLYPTWRCGFGSNPFSVMSLNERNLYCFDVREKNDTAKVIFDAQNPTFYPGEILVGLKQCNKNSFQHFLTSNHHLILCDERYPKTPVMYWNHCLKNPPVYLDCADIDADVSAIVIGTQRNSQLALFLCSHLSEVQPISLSPPLLLSSPSDCVDSLKLHCHYVDDKIASRFDHPLTGICIVPYDKENGFTVFQSTSLGDIFYQDFKQSSEASEKTYRVSTGCTLTPSEKILPHLNELLTKSEPKKVPDNADRFSTPMIVNINKILSLPKKISSNCMFCRQHTTTEDKELVLSEKCPFCNLSCAESEKLSKALTNESLIIGPLSEDSNFLDCDIDYLSKFGDKYSKRILSLWLKSDNECSEKEDEAGFCSISS